MLLKSDPPSPSTRLDFVDNIRSTMVLLVLSMHAADTYSPFGNWYYTDRTVVAIPTALFFAFYQTFLQAFFMGLLFLIAGYFAAASLSRKGRAAFSADRLRRLGLPTLLYMLVIGPLTEYYVAKSWHTSRPFYEAVWEHARTGELLSETGPLWFCVALLLFSVTYAWISDFSSPGPAERVAASPLRHRNLALFTVGLATATFAVRIRIPSGAAYLNMQLADFPQYIAMFGAGVAARRHDWLRTLRNDFARRWCVTTLCGGTLLWAVVVVEGGALSGRYSTYGGGLHWQSAGMSLWAALTCVGMTLGLVALFRTYRIYAPRTGQLLARNAFAIYVLHPPVLITIARALHWLSFGPIAKFVLLTFMSAFVTLLVSELVARRIPLLKDILYY